MKPKQTILLIISFLVVSNSYSQLQADYWMINSGNYMFFHRASYPDSMHYPVSTLGFVQNGNISYSDSNGNLLFYGGGGGVLYDKNFEIFPSLNPSVLFAPLYDIQPNIIATQSILAVPYPGHDSLYIVFHIRCEFNNNYHSQLYYSILNMNLRKGLGEIEPGQKNIPLLNGVDVSFKLTGVLHCNKKDVWVIGHLTDSDKYFSLLITSAGISSSPVYFSGNYIPFRNRGGCIKV